MTTTYAKTKCEVTRADFAANAGKLRITIADPVSGKVVFDEVVDPRTFSTGSMGWNANGKGKANVLSQTATVQVGVNVTIVGSKELPLDANTAAA